MCRRRYIVDGVDSLPVSFSRTEGVAASFEGDDTVVRVLLDKDAYSHQGMRTLSMYSE